MLTTCKNELDPSDESECSSIEILRALTEHLKAPPQKRRQSQALSVTFQQDQPAPVEDDDDDIDDMYFSAVSFISFPNLSPIILNPYFSFVFYPVKYKEKEN